MTSITETSTFDSDVPRVDTTDPVLGGIGGESNAAAIALANRTRYLKDNLQAYTDVIVVDVNTTIDNSFKQSLISLEITDNRTLTIGDLNGFKLGEKLVFKCKCGTVKNASFIPTGSQKFMDGSIERTIFWLYDGEEITLVKKSGIEWEMTNHRGNLDIVGNDAFVRKQKRNTVIANGCNPETAGALLSRTDYARLWAEHSATAIADSLWLSDPLNYRTLFSQGDGVSTFRVPDMRAMGMRGLDLGRGISLGRVGSNPGSFEKDAIVDHGHTFQLNENGTANSAVGDFSYAAITDNYYIAKSTAKTQGTIKNDGTPNSGTETIMKNAGFIPVIYY